jgi:ribose-phosphate pyrophosphokinase
VAVDFIVPVGADALGATLAQALGARVARVEAREFPDGECYVRLLDDCAGRTVLVAADLSRPNPRLASLLLTAATARDLGARHVLLAAPYLPYMRQDARFKPGEGITSRYFARLVSAHFDGLVTVDPHLHRYKSLDEIYSIPSAVLSAAPLLAAWIAREIPRPLLIGPDAESAQWTEAVAKRAGGACVVLEKVRHGDREVEIAMRDIERHRGETPVLIDDIISTGRTLAAAARRLDELGFPAPVCAAVHAVFAGDAEDALDEAGITHIATTDTIPHRTNRVAVGDLMAEGVRALVGRL